MIEALLDLSLGVLLLALIRLTVRPGPLLRSVALFVAFGLLMTLIWLRLRAPDLALAEAAVGTALTVVLVLDALGWLRQHVRRRGKEEPDET